MSFLLGELAERWRAIPSAPEFLVSDKGSVRRASTGRPISPHERSGYLRVTLLSANGRLIHRHVAALVLEAFVGPRPSARHHAAHAPDRDRRNNRLENLLWKLPEENEADKREHGTESKGGAMRPLGARVVARIRARAMSGESYTAIADDYGIHRHTVSRVVRGLRHGSDTEARP
jgi:hypothetical protein